MDALETGTFIKNTAGGKNGCTRLVLLSRIPLEGRMDALETGTFIKNTAGGKNGCTRDWYYYPSRINKFRV